MGNITEVRTVVYVRERDRNCLRVRDHRKIDRDDSAAHSLSACGESIATSNRHSTDRDRVREGNDHLVPLEVCLRTPPAFDPGITRKWQRDIKSTGGTVGLS